MKLLDLFCCQGGAGMGYYQAGFEVTGVDIKDQPKYPFAFIQDDAIEYVKKHGHKYDLIHASPPCQAYSRTQKIQSNDHPVLITEVRNTILKIGASYVIENVEEAKKELLNPVMLCGSFFGLQTYRHRLFETSFKVEEPKHLPHLNKNTKMGRPVKPGEYMHIVGNFSGVQMAREIMQMPWANRDGLREAVPPAYTKYIGEQFLKQL